MWQDQVDNYGLDFDRMDEVEGRAHITMMATALSVEVSEFIEEFQWKAWKEPTADFPIRNSSDKVAAEAVDVLHFLAHLLNAAGVSEDDLNEAMAIKRAENERRQRVGYSY